MAIQWGGVAGMIFFYLLILAVGLWASKKTKGTKTSERAMIADRDIGWIVGLLTLTATSVGGGFILGTAEVVSSPGLGVFWAQVPWVGAISFFIGGLFFARKMREKMYVTVIDPFQEKFGNPMGGLLFLVAVMGELLWTASILSALGATFNVILELDQNISIVVSAVIAGGYTLLGGLFSVAYTDIVQLGLVFGGLWLCVPFALTNDAVTPLPETVDNWIGGWSNLLAGQWLDYFFLIIFAGLPSPAFYQRALATKTPAHAQYMTYGAALGIIIFSIPAYIIGGIGASTDWSLTAINLNVTNPISTPSIVLPAVIQFLTPPVIAFLGLGAISAAVMSSTDSSILASSSMFVRNVYRNIFRPSASDNEQLWVLRITVIIVTAIATGLAIVAGSIYGLFILCGDFIYCMLTPQFICVIYIEKSNTYGSLTSFIVAVFLRLASGEPFLNLPTLIRYPLYDPLFGQLFPFRSLIAVLAFITLILVSYITHFIFTRGYLSEKFDIFKCVVNIQGDTDDIVQAKSEPPEDKSYDNVASQL